MRNPVSSIFRFLDAPSSPARENVIEQYIDSYHALLRGTDEVCMDSIEDFHRAASSNLHMGAATNAIVVSVFVYAALRLPECLDRVSRVLIVPTEEILMTDTCQDIDSWKPAPARARRRRALFNGRDTLVVFPSSVSDIDDLIPALCAYQIEWNKMHERLKGFDHRLRSSRATISEVRNTLKTALRIPSADQEMLEYIWGDQLNTIVGAIGSSPKHFRVRMYPSDEESYKREVRRWWHDLLDHFHDAGIEKRPLYLVSSNTHSLANILSGFCYRHRHELVAHALEQDREGLRRRWNWLRGEDDEAKLNFYYYAQRILAEKDGDHRVIQQEMEEKAGLRRFRYGRFADQETQIIDLSRLRSDSLDMRLDRHNMDIMKKSRALVLNIDYPLGFSAYYIMSQIAREAQDLRGVYIMGKSAAMIGRVGDIMIPSQIRDEHTRNRYLFTNCFSVRDLVGYLRDIAVFDDQRSVTVRGTFLHSRDSIRDLRRDDFTGIEMEAGPYLSALYEYIHDTPAPREGTVRIAPDRPLEIGVLHYTSDVPYNVRASLLSSRLGYIGLEATYTCTLAIMQSIVNREAKIMGTGKRS